MKKKLLAAICLSFTFSLLLTGCGAAKSENGEVVVYNWGEYIDPETLDMFEEETGIDVVYEEFETNEIMYPKIQSGCRLSAQLWQQVYQQQSFRWVWQPAAFWKPAI